MCVHVQVSSQVTTPWDSASATITVPAGLSPERTCKALQAVLSKLHVEQPPNGAVCWCGALIQTPSIPVQPLTR